MSWKAEVIADSTGEWIANALRFATKEEAERYVSDLEGRWMAVRKTRVVESDEVVNERFVDGRLESIEKEVSDG